MPRQPRPLSETLPQYLFQFSIIFFAIAYGMLAWESNWFPANAARTALAAVQQLRGVEDELLLNEGLSDRAAPALAPGASMQPGYTLITTRDEILTAAVIDASGEAIQEWSIDWHTIWPDATHVPAKKMPKTKPGTHIHGAVLLEDGDLVFSFEYLGLVRLDPCGNVVWRLPYLTHHSVHLDSKGTLWVSAHVNHNKVDPRFPNYKPPFIEPTVLRVSTDGELLLEKSVMELLQDNNLQGLLYMRTGKMFSTETSGDTLHLNDVKTFDDPNASGVFALGDIMISLRNVNAVLIFDSQWRLKQQWHGGFVRQHDPDFMDANRVSVYDNNLIGVPAAKQSSRIVIRDFSSGQDTTWFEGNADVPFFSFVMGKHEWLENGNLLVSEPTGSRVFELATEGALAWEYRHVKDDGEPGLIEEAQRLPLSFTPELFARRRQQCAP